MVVLFVCVKMMGEFFVIVKLIDWDVIVFSICIFEVNLCYLMLMFSGVSVFFRCLSLERIMRGLVLG